MSENNINNFKALIEQKRIVKKAIAKSLLAFGAPDNKSISKYRPVGILWEDLLEQIKKEVGTGTLQDLASVLSTGNDAGTNNILLGLNELQLVGDSIYQDGVLNILGVTGGVYFEDETGASMEFSQGFGLDIIGASQLWLDTTTADGTLKFQAANGTAFSGTLGASLALTADRTWRLPDAEGTVALESAITEVLTFGGGASGDVRTMTVTGGIITARTLVP